MGVVDFSSSLGHYHHYHMPVMPKGKKDHLFCIQKKKQCNRRDRPRGMNISFSKSLIISSVFLCGKTCYSVPHICSNSTTATSGKIAKRAILPRQQLFDYLSCMTTFQKQEIVRPFLFHLLHLICASVFLM